MTSPTQSIQTSKSEGRSFPLSKRFLWVLLALCIQMTYIPTSNRIEGGFEPKLPFDNVPISAIWVLPYISCYALWAASFGWILFKAEDRAFRSFLIACWFTFSIGALTFIFFPTYVPAAVLEGDDLFTNLLRFIHEEWGRYAALPSGHVYITTLLALFFSRWHPPARPLWLLILIVVSLSTLFTGQHYLLDVLGGYLAAVAGYYFSLWWSGVHQEQKPTGKQIASSLN